MHSYLDTDTWMSEQLMMGTLIHGWVGERIGEVGVLLYGWVGVRMGGWMGNRCADGRADEWVGG